MSCYLGKMGNFTMSTPSLDTLIELGAIADAQGLKGQIKVRPHSTDPVALLSSKEIWLSLIPRQDWRYVVRHAPAWPDGDAARHVG